MVPVVKSWIATKHHEDSPDFPSVLEISTRVFQGDVHVGITPDRSDFVRIWDSQQFNELVSGLIEAGKQAGYDVSAFDQQPKDKGNEQ